MNEFQIGKIRVTRVEEWQGDFLSPAELFVGYEQALFSAHQNDFSADVYNKEDDTIYAFLQSWLLEIGGLKIIYDTGAGNDKDRPGIPLFGELQTKFLQRLKTAGYVPEDIDIVICSHLHIDHVGWNTKLVDRQWVPTFPNARYLFSAKEIEFWNPANADKFPDKIGEEVNTCVFEDSVQPIIDAGIVESISGQFEVLPGLVLEPGPGHTPGHMVMKVESCGEQGIFVGDILHHPIQIYCPTWNSIFCEQAEQARNTRQEVLAYAAKNKALVFPAHFGGQHAVWVTEKGDGYELAYTKPL
jgi:glyoxylase-like metal-dependent hydrolase (beta-lactamase superfamily II)